MNPCLTPDCQNVGVLPYERHNPDLTVTPGFLCFPCDTAATASGPTDDGRDYAAEVLDHHVDKQDALNALVEAAPDPETMFHTDVTAGLAAMVLEIVASAMTDEDGAVEQAMVLLAGNTRLPNDVAAGIILAVTAVAAAGGIDSAAMLELATVYEGLVEDDDLDEDDGQDDEHDDLDADDDGEDDPELVACLTCDATFVGAANLAAHECDGTTDTSVSVERDKEGSAA